MWGYNKENPMLDIEIEGQPARGVSIDFDNLTLGWLQDSILGLEIVKEDIISQNQMDMLKATLGEIVAKNK